MDANRLYGTWKAVSISKDGQTLSCPTAAGQGLWGPNKTFVTCGVDQLTFYSDGTFVDQFDYPSEGTKGKSTGVYSLSTNGVLSALCGLYGEDDNGDGTVSADEMHPMSPTDPDAQSTGPVQLTASTLTWGPDSDGIVWTLQRQ